MINTNYLNNLMVQLNIMIILLLILIKSNTYIYSLGYTYKLYGSLIRSYSY